MVFSSLTFLLYFLPIVMFIYIIAPKALKNTVLLLASLFFYAWGEPVYIILMIFSIIVNFYFGRFIERARAAELSKSALTMHMWMAVLFNLSILFYFKYINLVLSGLNLIFHTKMQISGLALPIGISFYTFQALSYVVDVYRGRVHSNPNLINFAVYIVCFPQLIAGPIVRYSDIEKQLRRRKLSAGAFGKGMELFITGLSKKVLLANQLGAIFTSINTVPEKTFILGWLAAITYSLQLYFDFSGYSDMAIGLGYMLGFKFPKNFNYPYIADSVTDFWRRWHITLSAWFREYVYIPLGGNRVSVKRHLLNLLIVWALTGLWHGASINFLLWGLYYALFLILEKYVIKDRLKNQAVIRHLYTGLVFIIGWVIFAYTDFKEMGHTLASMFFLGKGFVDRASLYYLKIAAIPVILGAFCATPIPYSFKKEIMPKAGIRSIILNCALLILCIACIVYNSYNPFLYFRF